MDCYNGDESCINHYHNVRTALKQQTVGDNMETYLVGLTAMGGALAYNLWGLFKAYAHTKSTPLTEVWSPVKTLLTIVPSLAAAFVAAYSGQLDPNSMGAVITIFIAGFGLAAAGSKIGVDSFFD